VKLLDILKTMPPWEWPADARPVLLDVLRHPATESDLLTATELAGDPVVIDDEVVGVLLSLLQRGDASETVRAAAAISLGAVLEGADTDGFEDPDAVPITERTFREIRKRLHRLFLDGGVPEEVRRRILEASVRAPEDWHRDAVRAAYSSDDESWRLTAVFCMRFVRGFEAQILEALGSANPDIHYEAVVAAGTWALDAAWPHVAALAAPGTTDKPLLLAAIEAVASIRPHDAARILAELADSDDEEVVDAVDEALAMASGTSGAGDEFDDDEPDDDDLDDDEPDDDDPDDDDPDDDDRLH